jgi:aconitate hydratase
MIRGTFANVRLRNRLVEKEGGFTRHFPDGESLDSLGLTGEEVIHVGDLEDGEAKAVEVTATRDDGDPVTFEARVRIDTPNEVLYFRNGGILHHVLRQLR